MLLCRVVLCVECMDMLYVRASISVCACVFVLVIVSVCLCYVSVCVMLCV